LGTKATNIYIDKCHDVNNKTPTKDKSRNAENQGRHSGG